MREDLLYLISEEELKYDHSAELAYIDGLAASNLLDWDRIAVAGHPAIYAPVHHVGERIYLEPYDG